MQTVLLRRYPALQDVHVIEELTQVSHNPPQSEQTPELLYVLSGHCAKHYLFVVKL